MAVRESEGELRGSLFRARPTDPRAGSRSAFSYRRREPEKTLLHEVVRGHLETFLARSREREAGLPFFVERELRAYLDCGTRAAGALILRADRLPNEAPSS